MFDIFVVILLVMNLSFDILASCETNFDDPIDSNNLSVRDYLPLIWKDSSTHIYGLAGSVRSGLSFARK